MDQREREAKVAGCLFGLALGDAYGAPTEFLSYNDILGRWPPAGPVELEGDPIRVTDDTQMTLAVGEGLVAATSGGALSPAEVEHALRRTFTEWLNSPDNNRAPGMTCLRACEGLERGQPWTEATVRDSKGCGANMRVAPVGLLSFGGDGAAPLLRAAVAQFQAALTHGHPTALAASDLTSYTIAQLAAGADPVTLPGSIRRYAESQRSIYHEGWLGNLWERPGVNSPAEFIGRGWEECLRALDRLDVALAAPDYDDDPCLATGAGWIAEEAFATGLLCFLMHPAQPRRLLQRAATSSGDSDSIACLAGAFVGAHLGISAWPASWIERIEYRERLNTIAQEMSRIEIENTAA